MWLLEFKFSAVISKQLGLRWHLAQCTEADSLKKKTELMNMKIVVLLMDLSKSVWHQITVVYRRLKTHTLLVFLCND